MAEPTLWRCPDCGQSFVTRDMPHSCAVHYVHRVRLRKPEHVDAELRARLAEAREVGDRRHVTDPDWPCERRPPDWVRVPGSAQPRSAS
jgi:hypothetical protein